MQAGGVIGVLHGHIGGAFGAVGYAANAGNPAQERIQLLRRHAQAHMQAAGRIALDVAVLVEAFDVAVQVFNKRLHALAIRVKIR